MCVSFDAQVEELAHEQNLEVKDSTLDFFGLAVKAAELPSFVARMRILSRKVQARIFGDQSHPAYAREV